MIKSRPSCFFETQCKKLRQQKLHYSTCSHCTASHKNSQI